MNQSMMYFAEMNQAVPGSFASPLMEPAFECRVPSPSEWSDVCRSPPLLHSPPHFSDHLDKIKEEPFSPQPISFLRTPPHTFYSVNLPLMSSEGTGEHSINIAELLAENSSLQAQVQQQQTGQKEEKPKTSPSVSEPIDFLGLLDVKSEFEEVETFVTLPEPSDAGCGIPAISIAASSPVSPSLPAPSGNGADVLFIALDHYRQNFQEVSMKLNIPSDPSHWTVQNVRSWLQYEAAKIEIPLPSLENWLIPGANLIQLTETQFREMFPKGGNLFYANLEIWKAAFRTTSPLQPPTSVMSSISQDFFQLQQPTPQSVSPIVGQRTEPLFAVASISSFDIPVTIPSPTLQPLATVTSVADVPSTDDDTSAQQQMPEKAAVTQVVSSTQSQPSILPATTTSSLFSPSTKPSTSTGKSENLIEVQPLGIQQMETNAPFVTDDSLLHIPTLLHAADASPQPTSTLQPRASRAKVGVGQANDDGGPTSSAGRGATHIHLWQFLKELLQKHQEHGACIRWLDRSKGIFKIEDSVRVARLWGARKNRPAMNYDKLSRSIRQYYKKGIMKKTERSQRLVYQFCHPYSL